ncbi:L10-interacting MYB domain-containing protein-like [Macadamia integrifolia]|uniref:L10-interacting MYB domain-containing protein-like n=1 Tax=Macadamia integrifolia TaxID=60698 RepID=UPI001C4FFF95|nr:L10-interacting MYB domain-containing protein-like [Macadamia integrifolia]XP_042513330.1 L10-interacting MYB domain-containing protein-like [Macadamia integrifolia]
MSTSTQAVNETAKWSQANVDTLIVLMVEEVKKGNRTTSTFNKAGWNNIANNFKEKTGVNYTIAQLKNKVNKLRQDYSQFKKLLETTGFGWDTTSRTCTVDDESIWESHIKDNPTGARFKKHGLPQWLELCMVFGDTYADGEGSGTQTTVLETLGADDARNIIESCDESSSADEVTPLGDTQTENSGKKASY